MIPPWKTMGGAPPAQVGVEIHRRRVALDLTRGQLARLAGVHLRTVENIERGWVKAPLSSSLEAVGRALAGADPRPGCQARRCVRAGSRICPDHRPRFEREGVA